MKRPFQESLLDSLLLGGAVNEDKGGFTGMKLSPARAHPQEVYIRGELRAVPRRPYLWREAGIAITQDWGLGSGSLHPPRSRT